MKVAVYGFGQVAKYLLSMLSEIPGVEIKYIVSTQDRSSILYPDVNFTTDPLIPVVDKSVDVIFECISDDIAAIEIAKNTITNNKWLISCNKKLWSMHSGAFSDFSEASREAVLLNSLACNDRGTTAYPEIVIKLSTLNSVPANELYAFRGCDAKCAAMTMVEDFKRIALEVHEK